jgi:hypothetical protein
MRRTYDGRGSLEPDVERRSDKRLHLRVRCRSRRDAEVVPVAYQNEEGHQASASGRAAKLQREEEHALYPSSSKTGRSSLDDPIFLPVLPFSANPCALILKSSSLRSMLALRTIQSVAEGVPSVNLRSQQTEVEKWSE